MRSKSGCADFIFHNGMKVQLFDLTGDANRQEAARRRRPAVGTQLLRGRGTYPDLSTNNCQSIFYIQHDDDCTIEV